MTTKTKTTKKTVKTKSNTLTTEHKQQLLNNINDELYKYKLNNNFWYFEFNTINELKNILAVELHEQYIVENLDIDKLFTISNIIKSITNILTFGQTINDGQIQSFRSAIRGISDIVENKKIKLLLNDLYKADDLNKILNIKACNHPLVHGFESLNDVHEKWRHAICFISDLENDKLDHMFKV